MGTTSFTNNHVVVDGTYYHQDTILGVINVLERVRKTGQRIRIFYGDTETGRDRLEEHDIMGTVGRSMGLIKVPLLIHNSRSHGGPSILTHNIMKITADGKTLYEHPEYHLGVFEVVAASENLQEKGYMTSVLVDGEVYANFRNLIQAKRWIAFMKGETNQK